MFYATQQSKSVLRSYEKKLGFYRTVKKLMSLLHLDYKSVSIMVRGARL